MARPNEFPKSLFLVSSKWHLLSFTVFFVPADDNYLAKSSVSLGLPQATTRTPSPFRPPSPSTTIAPSLAPPTFQIMENDGVRFKDSERVEWMMASVEGCERELFAPLLY
jgi:hypothetical protein